MFRFLDGPAGGIILDLRRAPIFLRVVVDQSGNWDALDQPDDEPQPGETIFVYRLVDGSVQNIIACSRGPKGKGCQRITHAEYTYHGQPEDSDVRKTDQWQAWATAEYEKENHEPKR